MSRRRQSIGTLKIGTPISSCILRELGSGSGAASGSPPHFLTRVTARIHVTDSCFRHVAVNSQDVCQSEAKEAYRLRRWKMTLLADSVEKVSRPFGVYAFGWIWPG